MVLVSTVEIVLLFFKSHHRFFKRLSFKATGYFTHSRGGLNRRDNFLYLKFCFFHQNEVKFDNLSSTYYFAFYVLYRVNISPIFLLSGGFMLNLIMHPKDKGTLIERSAKMLGTQSSAFKREIKSVKSNFKCFYHFYFVIIYS